MATLIAYPQAGSGGGNTTADAELPKTGGVTWAGARDATDSNSVDHTTTESIVAAEFFAAGDYRAVRNFATFDTSVIGTAGISVAVWSFTAQGKSDGYGDESIYMVATSPASNITFVTSDFNNITFTSWGGITVASVTTDSSTYNDVTLNATGRAGINKTGITATGSILGRDLTNTAPTGLGTRNYCSVRSADNGGTSTDPKLTITYGVSAAISNNLLLMGAG